MAVDNTVDVNSSLKQYVMAVDSYAATNPLLLRMKFQECAVIRVVTNRLFSYLLHINGSKHIQTQQSYGQDLQGCAITQTMLCGLTIYPTVQLLVSCSIYVPKLCESVGSRRKLLQQ